MLYGGIGLPVRRLSFGRSYCKLPLLAGAGGEVRGGEVGEYGIGLAVCCACILWGKGGGGIRRGLYALLGGNVCCLLRLLADAAGELCGGKVGEWGIGLAVCACILWSKGAGEIFRACMLSLGNVVCYRSLLELVGQEAMR